MEFIFFNENLEGKNKIRKIPKNVQDSTIIQTTKDSVQKFKKKKKKTQRICGELEQNMRILG